jgi:hypothetical protein
MGKVMNINCKLGLGLLLLIAQTGIAHGGWGTTRFLSDGESQKEPQIITVHYCDLVKNQEKYVGQVVRIRAVIVSLVHGASLYDSECKKNGIEPVFDCKNDGECSAMQKKLKKDQDYDGDEGRVEAVLIGSLVLPPSTAPAKSRARFMIKEIVETKRISRKVPWLSEN